jgi:hypothetical protein
MKSVRHDSQNDQVLALEQLKDVAVDGQNVVLVAVSGLAGAWASRNVVRAILVRRHRQLVDIKRDCRRLRGLLRDLD